MEALHTDALGAVNVHPPGEVCQPTVPAPDADETDRDDPVDRYADALEASDDTASDTYDERSLHSAAESQEALPAPDHEDQDQHRAAADSESERLKREKEEADFLRQQQEEVICRICFEGPGSKDDDGKDLGRLLKPCKCSGTMRYIHSGCLDAWRRHSRNSNSAVACDQCGAPYRFRRSRFVGLANSRLLIFLVSVLLFLLLVWAVGWSTLWMSNRYDGWGSLSFGLDWSELMYLDLDDDEYYTYRYAAAPPYDTDEGFSWDELGFLGRTVVQVALGSGMVGLISAFASLGLAVNPIGMGRFARGGLRDRWLGGGTRVGRGGRGKSDALAVTAFIVIVAVVLAGVARALYSTYQLVRRMSRRMLAYAEDNIVDWYGDDEQPPVEKSEPGAFPAPPVAEALGVQDVPRGQAEDLHVDDDMIDPEPDWLPNPGLAAPAA